MLMKLSTKGRYGLRAMIDLAVYANEEQVPLYAIAERQNISTTYLEQVFSLLRKAGLVKSIKGAQGGYILAEKPERITVGSILRTLEGDLSIVEYDEDGALDQTSNKSIQRCIKINVWDKMNAALSHLVDSITLEDLAEDYTNINNISAPMYYI